MSRREGGSRAPRRLRGRLALALSILGPLNAARDHLGDLLLHLRENIEVAAEEQGRPVQALWAEAIDTGTDPGSAPPPQRDEAK